MAETRATSRTMASIGRRYDEQREKILAALRGGETSRSMSGIEYYPKPWADLDLSIGADLYIVGVALAWDGAEPVLNMLRRLTPDELDAARRRRALFYEPCGPERDAKVKVIEAEILALRIGVLDNGVSYND